MSWIEIPVLKNDSFCSTTYHSRVNLKFLLWSWPNLSTTSDSQPIKWWMCLIMPSSSWSWASYNDSNHRMRGEWNFCLSSASSFLSWSWSSNLRLHLMCSRIYSRKWIMSMTTFNLRLLNWKLNFFWNLCHVSAWIHFISQSRLVYSWMSLRGNDDKVYFYSSCWTWWSSTLRNESMRSLLDLGLWLMLADSSKLRDLSRMCCR